MEKWYEHEGKDADVVVASRVRLLRNLSSYPFPDTMKEEDRQKLSEELLSSLQGMSTVLGYAFQTCHVDKMSEDQRLALTERAILNKGSARKKSPVSLMLSEDESISMVFNGDDHIRIQVSKSGNNLLGAWKLADRVDDFINERYEYAFDDQYGYLTAFPTDVGTAMKAYTVLHLPMLSSTRKFSAILGEMSRFGVTLKGAVGDGDENYGSLYVVFNQTTLGQSEENRIKMLDNICSQMVKQERRLRQDSLVSHSEDRRDQAYKAYGILKYARMLSLKDALEYLSLLRMGAYDNCIAFNRPDVIYDIMLSVLPHQIQYRAQHQGTPVTSGTEADSQRASYIREHLPQIV